MRNFGNEDLALFVVRKIHQRPFVLFRLARVELEVLGLDPLLLEPLHVDHQLHWLFKLLNLLPIFERIELKHVVEADALIVPYISLLFLYFSYRRNSRIVVCGCARCRKICPILAINQG